MLAAGAGAFVSALIAILVFLLLLRAGGQGGRDRTGDRMAADGPPGAGGPPEATRPAQAAPPAEPSVRSGGSPAGGQNASQVDPGAGPQEPSGPEEPEGSAEEEPPEGPRDVADGKQAEEESGPDVLMVRPIGAQGNDVQQGQPPQAPGEQFDGVFAGRARSQRGAMLEYAGGTREVDEAVERGLAWLVRKQQADGHWEGGPSDRTNCGVTGLSVLCFLGAGYTHEKGPHAEVMRRALEWLAAQQGEDGHFSTGQFYEQGICTMALAEAYAMTGNARARDVAQRGLHRIAAVQPASGGFDYHGAGTTDVSVTGWNVMAIKSAHAAKLLVPAQTLQGCETFLQRCTQADGSMGYRGDPPSGRSTSMTAVGAVCRQFLGHPANDPLLIAACDQIARAGPMLPALQAAPPNAATGPVGGGRTDIYYTYYGTLAMFMMGPKSDYWAHWNAAFRDPLIALQEREGDDDGSWPLPGDSWCSWGGVVCTTAMSILCLEVYWRFLPIYRSG